jgi:hypothetical protein
VFGTRPPGSNQLKFWRALNVFDQCVLGGLGLREIVGLGLSHVDASL